MLPEALCQRLSSSSGWVELAGKELYRQPVSLAQLLKDCFHSSVRRIATQSGFCMVYRECQGRNLAYSFLGSLEGVFSSCCPLELHLGTRQVRQGFQDSGKFPQERPVEVDDTQEPLEGVLVVRSVEIQEFGLISFQWNDPGCWHMVAQVLDLLLEEWRLLGVVEQACLLQALEDSSDFSLVLLQRVWCN